jgi:hypothetical protein
MKGKANYQAGRRFFNTNKQIDALHRQIDKRAKQKETETEDRNPIEVNDTGRVWRF